MSSLTYTIGSALEPLANDKKVQIIGHCCNDVGAWGAGFVMAISKQSPYPQRAYMEWAHSPKHLGESQFTDQLIPFELGQVQFVLFNKDTNSYIANIIGQHLIGHDENGEAPIRYEALRKGFQRICDVCLVQNGIAHFPRLGVGLAGGEWAIIERLLIEELVAKGVDVVVYTLPNEVDRFEYSEKVISFK